jgi:hypothetical protein
MEKFLDLSFAAMYDIFIDKDRTLNVSISCTYFSGCTEYSYDFTPYTGATLVVKNDSGTIVQTFSTLDGSILLQVGGVFKLIKTAIQMDTVRAGCYSYDMYLSSSTWAKRAFLYGKITYHQNIAN